MAKLGAYDIEYGNLFPAFDNLDVTIGKNGFIESNKKREGDKRTPESIYPVEFAFGYARFVKTAMPYRRADEESYWIDDPCSPRYNSWVTGRPANISAEKMKRKDHLYKLGFVIGHNMPDPKRGRGSAIFFHIWRRPGCCTCGCVAMAEEDLRSILSWLKPSKKPIVALGKSATGKSELMFAIVEGSDRCTKESR